MSIKILIVDDNRDTLRTYTRALQRRVKLDDFRRNPVTKDLSAQIEIESADTVSSALDRLRRHPFELLIVDLKIPGPSGEELGGLQLIEESLIIDPLRPIIAITGYGSVELARKTLTRGVFDFIEKSADAVDNLINAVQRAMERSDEKALRSGNPFTPMTGVEPTVFGGRTSELEFFEQRLQRALNTKFCEHFLVLGNWGIGKSTLLREYKKICQNRSHIASVIPLEPLQSGTTLLEAARSLVEGVLRDLPYPIDQFKKVTNFFDSLGISILGTGLQLKRDTTKKDLSTQAFLHDTLVKLWQDLEDKTGALVILLDDLDNFMAVPEIVMTLRQTLSMETFKKTKILIGIASTSAAWLELTSTNRHHPIARYFMSRVELGPLSKEELRHTIIDSLAGTAVSFSPEVMDMVYEYTEGHPYEMQVLCYHLFDNQLSRRVDANVWDKALQATLDKLGVAVFGYWFDQASSEEAKVLCIIANSDLPISVREIHQVASTGKAKISTGNIPKYLQRLVEKQLATKSARGFYTVTDKMFRAYLRSRSE